MAGDWIKMRSDLFTHPKVVRISSALKADTLRTVGGLMSVWCLFDAHSIDGQLDGYTTEVLDKYLRWDGFSKAMIDVGWLEEFNSEVLILPRFDTHNGQSAKRRAQDADRKRNVRKTSASESDKNRTREEKRREDIEPSGSKQPKGSRLKSDWQPTNSMIQFCKENRPDLNVQDVADIFRDYWIAKPGSDGTKSDWEATWRNWIRKQNSFAKPAKPKSSIDELMRYAT